MFSRQSSYLTITRAIAAKSPEVVHLCQTFRAQNNPLFGSNSVKKFHLSYGREEETRPRNYGSFLILIHAVSAAIPRGMAIASTIEYLTLVVHSLWHENLRHRSEIERLKERLRSDGFLMKNGERGVRVKRFFGSL